MDCGKTMADIIERKNLGWYGKWENTASATDWEIEGRKNQMVCLCLYDGLQSEDAKEMWGDAVLINGILPY